MTDLNEENKNGPDTSEGKDKSGTDNPDQASERNPEGPEDTGSGEVTKEEKQIAMLAHLLAIIGGFIAPLIIYLIKKDESQFIEHQSREALNFQISVFIASLVCMIIAVITCGYGAVLFPVLIIANIIFCIIAGLQANDGKRYEYPVNIRLIK